MHAGGAEPRQSAAAPTGGAGAAPPSLPPSLPLSIVRLTARHGAARRRSWPTCGGRSPRAGVEEEATGRVVASHRLAWHRIAWRRRGAARRGSRGARPIRSLRHRGGSRGGAAASCEAAEPVPGHAAAADADDGDDDDDDDDDAARRCQSCGGGRRGC
eukprot:scaffold179_cov368-Prasinococcus_capsulatus_cf.AAC.30